MSEGSRRSIASKSSDSSGSSSTSASSVGLTSSGSRSDRSASPWLTVSSLSSGTFSSALAIAAVLLSSRHWVAGTPQLARQPQCSGRYTYLVARGITVHRCANVPQGPEGVRRPVIPIALQIRNFMCYREPVDIDFRGIHVACLSGDNGAGKSALLDCITWALWGKARVNTDGELMALGASDMEVNF